MAGRSTERDCVEVMWWVFEGVAHGRWWLAGEDWVLGKVVMTWSRVGIWVWPETHSWAAFLCRNLWAICKVPRRSQPKVVVWSTFQWFGKSDRRVQQNSTLAIHTSFHNLIRQRFPFPTELQIILSISSRWKLQISSQPIHSWTQKPSQAHHWLTQPTHNSYPSFPTLHNYVIYGFVHNSQSVEISQVILSSS